MRPVLAGLPLLLAAVHSASAQELHRQNPVPGTQGLVSQEARNPGGIGWFAEAADDFTAAGAWSLGSVELWGFYDGIVPAPQATQAFVIRVYAMNAGMPGAELSEREVVSFTQEEAFQVGFYTDYKISAAIAPPIVLPGPGAYFLSVVAVRDSGGGASLPQWHWLKGVAGPPVARQWVFSPNQWAVTDISLAFVLHAANCYPDCNGDSLLNLADFGCFQTKFALSDPYADCNGDGVRNLSDFGCFLTKFALACP